MPKFLAQINASKIPILGLVPESGSTAPASPVKYQLWGDTTAGQGLKMYDGTSWVPVGAVQSVNGQTGAVTLTKSDVGLANVDNTSDVNKPISSATQTALNGKSDTGHKHAGADINSGTVGVGFGGTGAAITPTAGGVIYGVSGTAMGSSAAGASGQVLRSNGGSAPSWAALDLTFLPDSWLKKSVKAATTASITLSATQTIDGVAVAVGDRVLVKDQATASSNGIYTVQTGAWTRVSDMDVASEAAGATVSVEQGSSNGGSVWHTYFKTTDTLDTTVMNFVRVTDSTVSVSAGTGLLGGGSLSQTRTLSVDFATSGTSNTTQAVRADDSRLSNSRTPSGAAGGDLTGTYPNPTIGAAKVVPTHISAGLIANGGTVGGTAGTAADNVPALRSLGLLTGQAMPGGTPLNGIPAATGDLSLNNKKITNLLDPTNAQDAVTKNYVDNAVQGISGKNSVKVATTANIALTGTQTIDGIAVSAGDRVLVKNQTNLPENGIYVVSAGAWTRATDADTPAELNSAYVWVESGLQGDTGWLMVTNLISPTLGTDNINWTQFSGAGQITAGNGMTKTGNTLDVVGTANRITANADNIDIASTYAGQASITTVGTISSGTWHGSTLGILYGGTGATDPDTARQNIAAAAHGYWQMAPGTGITAGTWTTITHNFNLTVNQKIPNVTFTLNGDQVVFDLKYVDANSFQFRTDVAIATTDLLFALYTA